MNSKPVKDNFFNQFEKKNKSSLKEHAKIASAEAEEEYGKRGFVQQFCEDTMTKTISFSKIKLPIEQEETKKFGWQKSSQGQSEKKAETPEEEQSVAESANQTQEQSDMLEVPYNKRVEDILAKKSLRERLGGLLTPDQQLPISFNHQQLLKRMELIDRTIDFLENHRNIKTHFFETVKKSIFETGNTLIQFRNFQQLTFLNDKCYDLEWKMNQKTRRYDLKIQIPAFDSMDNRKAQMRNKIVLYLKLKEEEFLNERQLTKKQQRKWHSEFKYQEVQIPCRQLPVHPNTEKSDLRTFENKEIMKIANPVLKRLFESKKKNADVKSVSGASVADMIFSRIPAQQISSIIMESIKEKQRINKIQEQKARTAGKQIDKTAIIKVLQEILLIYMGKNVSNIFKTTLIELLQARLKFKDSLIVNYLNEILGVPGLNFLTEIESSKKLKVLRIDRQKYKTCRQHFAALQNS